MKIIWRFRFDLGSEKREMERGGSLFPSLDLREKTEVSFRSHLPPPI